jgi:hypothetical protein
MITWQDFEAMRTLDLQSALSKLLAWWQSGEEYRTARAADLYDRQKNETIMNYVKTMFSVTGMEIRDFTASNNKVTSNFFRRLNVQRNTYSLGNGITFAADGIKERFGDNFDGDIMRAAYLALIHGVCFPLWMGRMYVFSALEFAPLWDEDTGALMGGVRFWQIDADKPLHMVIYEADGYAEYKLHNGKFTIEKEKRGYVEKIIRTPADGVEVIGYGNYSAIPIVPLWGSSLHQSTLIGMRSKIDSYDLIRSGFANDLTDVAQIYWLLENYGGMNDEDMARFMDRMKINHVVEADTSEGGKITPYTQEIPYQARQTYLDGIRMGIYDDFGALDVRTMAGASKTATEIEAAYQPMDEEADDFEAQIIDFVQRLGALLGISAADATPIFKRNRIVNQMEQVEMLALEAAWLDRDTILQKLPNVTPDEVDAITARREEEDRDRLVRREELEATDEKEEPNAGDVNV